MRLHIDILFYWIQKEFPGAFCCNSNIDEMKSYCSPMFPGDPAQMREHIVVVSDKSGVQTVSQVPDCLPVFIGPGSYSGAYISLPAQTDYARVFNCLQEIFARFRQWNQLMEQAVFKSYSFDALIQLCDPLLEEPMCLADNHFRYVSFSRKLAQDNGYEAEYVGEGNYLPLDYINQLTAMPDFTQTEAFRDVYQYNCITPVQHKNIFYQGTFAGRLALPQTDSPARNRYYCQMLREVSVYVEQLYELTGSFWHRKASTSRLSTLLLKLLEGNQVELDVLGRLMVNQGYQLGDELCLIQMRSHFITNESKLSTALTSQLERLWPGSCCMIWQQGLVVLLNLSHYNRDTKKLFNQELAVFLRESLLLAGISRSFTDIRRIQSSLLQTQIALEAGEELTPTYWYYKYDDYAYWDLLHHGCRNFLPEQVCHPAINVLRSYDQTNHTELAATLQAYISNQYNAVSTASALCVARSSFLKRMARIEELTKIDLSQFETRLYLAMSFALFDQQEAGTFHMMGMGQN